MDKNATYKLPERLEKEFEKRGCKTPYQISKMYHLNKSTVAGWLGGQSPKASDLFELAKALEVSADYLLGFHDHEALQEDIQAVSALTGLSPEAIYTLKCLNTAVNDPSNPASDSNKAQLNAIDKMLAHARIQKNFGGPDVILKPDDNTINEISKMVDEDIQKEKSADKANKIPRNKRYQVCAATVSECDYYECDTIFKHIAAYIGLPQANTDRSRIVYFDLIKDTDTLDIIRPYLIDLIREALDEMKEDK